jgi:hypothetical protein
LKKNEPGRLLTNFSSTTFIPRCIRSYKDNKRPLHSGWKNNTRLSGLENSCQSLSLRRMNQLNKAKGMDQKASSTISNINEIEE